MNAQAISTKAPWLSHRQILREFGYTAEQIETILDEFHQDKVDANVLGSTLLDAFNAGALPGHPGELVPEADDVEPGSQASTRNSGR